MQQQSVIRMLTSVVKTGLPNNTTVYNCQITVDGTQTYISQQGSTIQTFTDLINALNVDADFSALAVASIVNGNIRLTSKSYGANSTIQILDTNLFTSMIGYKGLLSAIAGVDPLLGLKSYVSHTSTQLLQVLNDGKDVKLTILQKFAVKKSQILAATDFASVDAITW